MSEIKNINKANLELALTENNKKVKDYVTNKTNKISIAQKTINTELDYCYLTFGENFTSYVLNIGDKLPFNYTKEKNNMSVNDDYSVTLKAGKTYKISADFWSGANPNVGILFDIYDLTNMKSLHKFTKTNGIPENGINKYIFVNTLDSIGNVIYTPETDCNIVVLVTDKIPGEVRLPNNIENLSNSYFIIEEINHQITIDPVEYVNTTNGLEDTPVGHIISHMGTTAPKHYLVCDGGEYNIVDYPYLVQHIIDNFGSTNYFGGDGTNTFCVPDLRGEFLRGTGTNSRENQGSGAEVGVHQDATWHTNLYSSSDFLQYYASANPELSTENHDSCMLKPLETGKTYSVSYTTNNWTEPIYEKSSSRPTNTSVLYCIKYEPTYFMNVNTPLVGRSETVLFEGSLIVGSAELSDSIENYDQLEVITRWNDGVLKSCKLISVKDIKYIPMEFDGSVIGASTSTAKNVFYFQFDNDKTISPHNSSSSYIEIYKVIGIKYQQVNTSSKSYTDEEIYNEVENILKGE